MTKTVTLLRHTVLSTIAGAAVAVFVVSGSALAASTESFQISPPTANYPANPGDIVHNTIKVTNLTDEPISLTVDKQNFAAKGEEGEVELVDNADPLYSLAPWFNVLQPTLDVAPRATKEVPYNIAVPKGAEPGGRYGSIVFHTIPPKLPSGQSGASVQQSIAALIFVRINGAANEQLSVTGFAPENSFYEYGPVKFLARLKNTGTVHEKATGTITIKNMLGFKVATIPLDEHFVIPSAIRRLHNQWPGSSKQAFLFGRYTATLNAKYGDGKTLTASAAFIVLPWKLLSLILIALLLVILFIWKGRKRFARAARILAGKE
jgi:hypothetical protein